MGGIPVAAPVSPQTPTPKFEVGQVVKLKSGGPLMTVARATINEVWVSWFDAEQRTHCKSNFIPGQLVVVYMY